MASPQPARWHLNLGERPSPARLKARIADDESMRLYPRVENRLLARPKAVADVPPSTAVQPAKSLIEKSSDPIQARLAPARPPCRISEPRDTQGTLRIRARAVHSAVNAGGPNGVPAKNQCLVALSLPSSLVVYLTDAIGISTFLFEFVCSLQDRFPKIGLVGNPGHGPKIAPAPTLAGSWS
jgi:hypothetical protein